MVCSKKIEKVVTIFIYLWVWWSTSILMYVEAATHGDSLMPGDTINATSTLYSKNNKFFIYFSTSDDNVDNHFVIAAIKEGGDTQIVWNFNRIPPLPLSAVLSLNHSGFLKIESQYGKPIIIYSPSEPTNNTVATLLDNGNFVLRELHPNGTPKNTVLWQSFDYPVDWLIPGMKLGVNRKIGRKWLVLSNILISNSNSGVFSLEWEQSELVIKQRGKVYWKSGKLRNNGTIFDNIPERRQQMFQYTIVSNTDEDSFTFKIKIENKKKVGAWKLFPNGELKSGYGTIANADMCYGFNTSNEIGCQKWDIPTCRKPGDVFQPKAGSPSYKNVINKENSSYVYSDCKCFCWNNCKCIGFQQYNENGTGCILFEENSTIEYDYGVKKVISYILTKPLQESPQQLHRKIHGGVKKWPLISAMIAASLLIISSLILYLAFKKRKSMLTGNTNNRARSCSKKACKNIWARSGGI